MGTKKTFVTIIVTLLAFMNIVLAPSKNIQASETGYANWNQVVDDMHKVLDDSLKIYKTGDIKSAKAKVDVAYFSYYEKLGFERKVMSQISGKRASEVEYLFGKIKKDMTNNETLTIVKTSVDSLKKMLREDAVKLDGGQNGFKVFLESFGIILREGVEAILIVGAILAYLKKMNSPKKNVNAVYVGSGVAIIASIIMAVVFSLVTWFSGANQEVIEGITMLIAVAVLFYVGNWMFSKAEADSWNLYIQKKVDSSLKKGSLFSLAFAAFLAVFREGAEIILFYQAILAGNSSVFLIVLGFISGVIILVGVFFLVKFLGMKVPMKPFFIATSVLMSIMSITFIGNGIKELQEGNVIGITVIKGMSSFDYLGIYPTYQTFIPQIALTVLTIVTFGLYILKWRRDKKKRVIELETN